jgi:hypothetical protein
MFCGWYVLLRICRFAALHGDIHSQPTQLLLIFLEHVTCVVAIVFEIRLFIRVCKEINRKSSVNDILVRILRHIELLHSPWSHEIDDFPVD